MRCYDIPNECIVGFTPQITTKGYVLTSNHIDDLKNDFITYIISDITSDFKVTSRVDSK